MSALLSDTAVVPRVIQCAKYEVPADIYAQRKLPVELTYLRVLSTLSTFLLHDTSEISENDANPLEADPGPIVFNEGSSESRARHHWIPLQHPELHFSAFYLHPYRDIFWISHETWREDLDDMSMYYGKQLSAIQNVLFEQMQWDDLDDCLGTLHHFRGVRVIYVWLDSYRFLAGKTVTNHQGYLDQAAEFQSRDRPAFQGRNVMVEYIDCEQNIYGGFRADFNG